MRAADRIRRAAEKPVLRIRTAKETGAIRLTGAVRMTGVAQESAASGLGVANAGTANPATTGAARTVANSRTRVLGEMPGQNGASAGARNQKAQIATARPAVRMQPVIGVSRHPNR
jgi:hypothetical protein